MPLSSIPSPTRIAPGYAPSFRQQHPHIWKPLSTAHNARINKHVHALDLVHTSGAARRSHVIGIIGHTWRRNPYGNSAQAEAYRAAAPPTKFIRTLCGRSANFRNSTRKPHA